MRKGYTKAKLPVAVTVRSCLALYISLVCSPGFADIQNAQGKPFTHWNDSLQEYEYAATGKSPMADGTSPEGRYRHHDGTHELIQETDGYDAVDANGDDISYYMFPFDGNYETATKHLVTRRNYYVGPNFSVFQRSKAKADELLTDLSALTGKNVRFSSPGDLVEDENALQIVHGHSLNMTHAELDALPAELKATLRTDSNGLWVDPGIMFTVFLPPNWNESATGLPIVSNTAYDLNYSMFPLSPIQKSNPGYGVSMGRIIAPTSDGTGTGAIGVIDNGGGGLGTFTRNPLAFYQFERMLQFVEDTYGGNPEELVILGNSRGGSAAFERAANPKLLDYTTKLVAVSSAGFNVADQSPGRGATATYPENMYYLAIGTSLLDGWRPDFSYPQTDGKSKVWSGLPSERINPHFVGKSSYTVLAETIYGFDITDTDYDTEAELKALPALSAETEAGFDANPDLKMLFELSAHDKVGYFMQVNLLNELFEKTDMDLDNRVRYDLTMRRGHGARFNADFSMTEIEVGVAKYVEWLAGVVPNQPNFSFGPHYWKMEKPVVPADGAVAVPFTPTGGRYPFTMDAPYIAMADVEFGVAIVGECSPASGDPWEYRLTLVDDLEVQVDEWLGSMPICGTDHFAAVAVETVSLPVSLLGGAAQGQFEWKFEFSQGAGAPIPLTITSGSAVADASGAVLTLLEEIPNVSAVNNAGISGVIETFSQPKSNLLQIKDYTGGLKGLVTCWGLSEY